MRDLDDQELAFHLATGIGRIVRGTRGGGLLKGKMLARISNQVAQVWVDQVLEAHRPDDAQLSEDARDDLARLDTDRVWIVDVIDGSKEFSTGRGDWSVHVSLVVDGEPGPSAVGLPDSKRVFRSDQVAYVDGPPSGILVVSRSHTPPETDRIAEAVGMAVRKMGSAGAKMLSVLLGDADAYFHTGGQREWDQAAPVGVARAAGLHCSRLDGSPLRFNQEDTRCPDILICRPELADRMISAAAAAS